MSPRYAIGGRMVSGGNPSRQSILTNRASPVKLFAGEWLTRMRHITVQINGPVLSGSVYRVVIGDGHTSLSTEKTTLPQAIKLARQFNQKHRKNLAHVDYVGQEKKEETSK